ncbi:MAG TPA: NYN domain-containing protein [Thermoanaerobaculia bacterium]|nr:NYN domain-containing protein [Thermoanaerobaculia bacterium]
MSPWWLRPTAEGASNEAESDDKQRGERPSADAPPPAPAAAEAEAQVAAPIPALTLPPPPPAPYHEAEPAEPEAPRFTVLDEEPAAPQAFEYAEPHPPAASPSYYEPNEQDELFPEDDEDEDLEADAEAGGEVELSATATQAEKDEAQAEKKSRRGRRSRGGRRRSGRSATAPANGGTGAAEEDDDEPEDTFEEPVQVAPTPIAPRRDQRREREREREARVPEERDRDRERERENFFVSPSEFLGREIYVPVPERPRSHTDEKKIALFCDLENIALGVRDSEVAKFDINLVLERLLEKGKIIVKKAYADWERYSDYKRPFHEAAIELIDIPQKYYSGKNSADIKMVVDAMDLSYSKEHLDTFVLLSGDSDFSPLVSKLKENNKYVIGIGVKNSSSNLLVDNCDEFIYYEDVWRDSSKAPQLSGLNKKAAEAFSLMVESIQALVRENKDVLWGSMIKQTMQRKKPSFNEGYYGYSTFSELLEDAERKNIIKLKKDQRSGTYIVTGFAKR